MSTGSNTSRIDWLNESVWGRVILTIAGTAVGVCCALLMKRLGLDPKKLFALTFRQLCKLAMAGWLGLVALLWAYTHWINLRNRLEKLTAVLVMIFVYMAGYSGAYNLEMHFASPTDANINAVFSLADIGYRFCQYIKANEDIPFSQAVGRFKQLMRSPASTMPQFER